MIINFVPHVYVWIIIFRTTLRFLGTRCNMAVWSNRVNIYVLRRVRHRGFVRSVCRPKSLRARGRIRLSRSNGCKKRCAPMCTHIDTLWGSSWVVEASGIYSLIRARILLTSMEKSLREQFSPRISLFLSITMFICSRQSFRYDQAL